MTKTNPQVLVVDDDLLVHRFIKDVTCKLYNVSFTGVVSIRNACESLEKQIPSVIFIDQSLPDGTGKQFCEDLAKKPELKKVPKWIISGAKPVSWDVKQWQDMGVKGYILKPIDIETLQTVMKTAGF